MIHKHISKYLLVLAAIALVVTSVACTQHSAGHAGHNDHQITGDVREIDLVIADRKLIPEQVQVTQGENIELRISTDEAGEFHLAGYELIKNIHVNQASELTFAADAAGRYNIELHPGVFSEEDHSDHHEDESHAGMHHDSREVESNLPTPTVDLVYHKDPASGHNFEIITSNFEFSPRGASRHHVPGQGHAHIYVDGKKINRVYTNWYHISKLSPGTHEVRVTLNSNDHSDLAKDEQLIEKVITVTVPSDESTESHDSHGHDDHDESAHSSAAKHDVLDVSDSSNPPTIAIEVHEDPKAGYNVEITTTNFEFSPQGASKEHVDGQGHAHVYLDNVKLNRVYGNWYHIASIDPGQHTIKVTLNANDHSDLTVDGQMVADTKTITVSGEATQSQNHDDHTDHDDGHGHDEGEHEDIPIGVLIVNPK